MTEALETINTLLNSEEFLQAPRLWNEQLATTIAGLPDPGKKAKACM